ncbi:MAG: phage head closure protein [Bacilli bacterium]
MMFSDVLALLSSEYAQDDIGQQVEVITEKNVFCHKRSIPQREFFEAGRTGIKASAIFVINTLDYADEMKVAYNGKTYTIYRTYEKGEQIELYCEVRNGNKN